MLEEKLERGILNDNERHLEIDKEADLALQTIARQNYSDEDLFGLLTKYRVREAVDSNEMQEMVDALFEDIDGNIRNSNSYVANSAFLDLLRLYNNLCEKKVDLVFDAAESGVETYSHRFSSWRKQDLFALLSKTCERMGGKQEVVKVVPPTERDIFIELLKDF